MRALAGGASAFLLTLAAAFVLAPALAPALAAESVPETQELAADEELLGRILEEEEIATQRPVTRLEWMRHVWDTYWMRALDKLAEAGPVVGFVAEAVLWVVVIGVPLLVGLHLWRRLRGTRVEGEVRERAAPLETVDRIPPEGDLREALEAELRAGRPRNALRCAWIWMARRLAERGVGRFELDVTNREFAESVRRLAPGWPGQAGLDRLARRSERLLYAEEPCTEADVREFVRGAEALTP